MTKSKELLVQLIEKIKLTLSNNPELNVFKIYDNIPNMVYFYRKFKSDGPYETKERYTKEIPYSDISHLISGVRQVLTEIPGITYCRCTQNEQCLRIRFLNEDDPVYKKIAILNQIMHNIKQEKTENNIVKPDTRMSQTTPVSYKPERNKKKMESFSLSNLKDAVIDKVTHLDRKTVTILAIIALLLLIVGKYQTIKDILIGVKDKVKRSKNFKAMVEDGTNAINNLKKIVGIKDKGVTNEA